MNQTTTNDKNGTTARPTQWQLQALKTGLRVLGPAAPGITARIAENLFLKANRHPRPAWEYELIEKAQSFRIGYEDGFLPAWSWGEGRAGTVLLVHGWEGRGAQLGAFVAPLLWRGFRVVTFDGPGHGGSTFSRASMPDMAAAIEQVVAAVGPLHGIVAHSMGGAASLVALTRTVTASRAVFLAPPVDMRTYVQSFGEMFEFGPTVMSQFERQIEARFNVSLDEFYAPKLAKNMATQLLVIHDEGDREVPWQSGKRMAEAWPGAELFTTRGLGHRRPLKHPEVIARTIAFLQGHAGTPRALSLSDAEPTWMAALME